MTSGETVVRSYLAALEEGDLEAANGLLCDEFRLPRALQDHWQESVAALGLGDAVADLDVDAVADSGTSEQIRVSGRGLSAPVELRVLRSREEALLCGPWTRHAKFVTELSDTLDRPLTPTLDPFDTMRGDLWPSDVEDRPGDPVTGEVAAASGENPDRAAVRFAQAGDLAIEVAVLKYGSAARARTAVKLEALPVMPHAFESRPTCAQGVSAFLLPGESASLLSQQGSPTVESWLVVPYSETQLILRMEGPRSQMLSNERTELETAVLEGLGACG